MTLASAGLPAPADHLRKQPPPGPDDAVIDLGAFVANLARYRIAIAAVMVLSAIGLAGVALMGGRVYSATTSVMLSQSKITDRLDLAASVATFQPMLESASVAASVIKELGLDQPPRNMSSTRFFRDIVTVEPVRNTTIIRLTAVLDDPVLAARVANRVAEKGVEMARRVSQQEALRSRDSLQEQRDEMKARLESAAAALRRFRDTSQLELLRKDVDAMLGQRGDLLSLLIEIETEKATLARAEQELAGRQRIGTVKRSIDSDPAMMEAARKAADPTGTLLSLETRNEFVDKVYETVDEQVASTRAELAGLERKKAQLIDVRKLDGPQNTQLSRLYNLESELLQRQMEYDLAATVYKQVATAYETARMQVASRSAQLDVLDPAVAPDRPLSRPIARNALIGLFAGFVFASIGVAVYSNMIGHDGFPTSLSRRSG